MKMIFGFILLTIISFFSLEFIFLLKPCELCLWQRLPYYLSLIIIILFKKNKKISLSLLLITFICAIGLSVFHILVEQNIFSFTCTVQENYLNIEDLLQGLKNAKPDCTLMPKFLGIRVTFLALMMNAFMLFLIIVNLRKR